MKRTILILFITVLSTITFGQQIDTTSTQPIKIEEEKPPFKNKLYTGGNLGLTFGTYTNVMIAPLLGIRWTRKLITEVALEYSYSKDNTYENSHSYNQYGGRTNVQFYFIPQLFAEAEFAAMSLENYNINTLNYERHFVPFLYLGAGYRQIIANRSFISFKILFDVLNNRYSPYSPGEPYYSIGFGVGF